MQKLDIDFQHPAGKTHYAGKALLVFAVIAGLVLLTMQRDLNDQVALLDASQGRAEASERLIAGSKQEGDPSLQVAYNQLMLPWGDVFASVEDAADEQVLLMGLEGDGRNRAVKIAAQAPHAVAMLDYLERLKSNGKLSGWRLLSHREDDKGSLHFVIQADLPEGL